MVWLGLHRLSVWKEDVGRLQCGAARNRRKHRLCGCEEGLLRLRRHPQQTSDRLPGRGFGWGGCSLGSQSLGGGQEPGRRMATRDRKCPGPAF